MATAMGKAVDLLGSNAKTTIKSRHSNHSNVVL